MPKQKDLKRLVRSRMQKTGESYTAARAQLTTKQASSYAALAGMSDEAVRAKTGKDWKEWVRALDGVGAAKKPHREIASHLDEVYGVPGWWCQTVTVGYERIRGLREIGQRREGTYEASKSRTFPVPVATLYEAFASSRGRARWLPGIAVTVRKATPRKSVRITWPDQTSVEVYLTDKGSKSQAAIQHRKLRTRSEAVKMKAWWGDRFDALAEVLKP